MQLDPSVFVHSHGICESEDVGPRTRIWAFAHVLAGAVIGSDCNVCDHAYIEGGATVGSRVTLKNAVLVWDRVTIEDDVFVGPNAVFTNDLNPRSFVKKNRTAFSPTLVCRGATIGANATIVCGTVIGRLAFVAAGAVVTSDVPPHALVAGSPARLKGWVCLCASRLNESLICQCGRRYRLISEREGLEEISPVCTVPASPLGGFGGE